MLVPRSAAVAVFAAVIVVRTSVVELGLYRDDYESFVAALEAEGFPARVDAVGREFRSNLGHHAVQLGIFLLEGVAVDLAVEAIRRAASATISRARGGRRTQPTRRLPIYAPNGLDVLSWVELPADEGQAS